MGQDFFSTYQAGEDLEEAFHAAKKNALIYHGTYQDNGSISTVRAVRPWFMDPVPDGYLARLKSRFLFAHQGMRLMAGEECLAVPVARQEDFSWRDLRLMVFLKQDKPHFSDEDIYGEIEEHILVEAEEMVVALETTHLSEEVETKKSQGALLEEDVYLLSHDGELNMSNTFALASEAEEEAIRLSEKEGGTYSVFLLRQGSDGQPLFSSTLIAKEHRVEARFSLARAKAKQEVIGWYFFGFGLS